MNIFKRHKGLTIVSGLALILIVIIFAIFSRMLFSTGKGEYGDRLNGVSSVESKDLKEAEESLKENDEVISAKVRVQGRIIYTTITFSEDTSIDKAKEIAESVREAFSDDVLEDYDFEFLLTEEIAETEEDESSEGFNIAGTKVPANEEVTWTRK